MSTYESLPGQSKELNNELSFDATDMRHVLVNGQPMEIDEKTYSVYREAGAIIEEIPHSGFHGESPVREFDKTSLAQAHQDNLATSDAIPVTPTPPAHDVIHSTTQEKLPRRLTRKQKIAAATLGGVLTAGAVVGVGTSAAIMKRSNDVTEELLNPDKANSATPFPEDTGNNSMYTPSSEPYLTETDPSYEDIKLPATLSPEQMSLWQSGDKELQNSVASDVLAPRISVAIHEMYDARQQGVTVDTSWLSSDETVQDDLEKVVDYFIDTSNQDGEVEWFAFNICRTNVDYASLARCNVKNLPEDKMINYAPGSPVRFAVTRETSESSDLEQRNAGFFELSKTQVALNGDTLILTSK